MDIINLEKFLKDMGESGYRLKQIKKAVFVDLIKDWEEATTLSKKLREEIKKEFNILSWEVLNIIESKNKDSVKAIFKLKDGNIIETVLMKHLNTKEDDTKNGRNTVCVSSQAGCAINCEFCATGKMGLKRNLTGEEIIDQVLFFARHLRQWQGETLTLDVKVSPCHDRYEKVNNVVFMGMGEPFLNYDNTIQAIRILNDKDGFNLGIRHISVSTCGIIPGIEKFAEENLQVNLAISLHAADDETRTKLMPINKTYPLAELMKAVGDYIKKTNRKVMFEYLLIDGVNDQSEDAANLAKLMKNSLYHINLIKYHDTGSGLKPSPQAKRTQFFDALKKIGVSATFRVSFGEDILAACGQLARKIQ
ncbi:MAG: 23S rRNA (adenine(2503)-C(2))-methyltransferase [Candidatus Terrybacteria bacterium RIFCSPLOWO2_02_42_20]|uniref:Probable dual-specificity RNA methyltransferase RlmN n=2 Tax=Candidatus Terryibacteriota TaxID=1817920 RepID=A0A1G2PMN3_9BACT|nr:MAG: 23S rRNA (adenine(2503)-C(2))-methyltransferase [Candidatus Terrybacteria bacterium RIFCSPHIGHO2_02_41_19]OHA54426.1 MAG: 23S rRNA (adenine(2503)-C(2))-methyltransferase [Candidatus Terrybacteria bacterium RIFCSPLOWO2_02_42_20]